jgi:hypothetical protein
MSNGKNENGKRNASVLDQQFEFPPVEKWRQVKDKKVFATDYIVHTKSHFIGQEQNPSVIEFVLKEDEVFSFGPQTRFKVTGQFQKKTGAVAEWVACEEADYANVVVAPNWWEKLIKELDIFHGNTKIVSSDEGRFISPYINAWKYAWMNPSQKQLLCPEPCHTGYAVPTKRDNKGWDKADNSEWKKYAKHVFLGAGKDFTFSWIPLDTQPFFQHSNYFQDGQVSKILPMPILSQLLIRFNFIDNWTHILKPTTVPSPAFQTEFRFLLKDFKLVAEHLRLYKPFQTSFLNKRHVLSYPGVTKLVQPVNIPHNSTTYQTKIQQIAMPEGMFVFALPRDVASGNYDFSKSTTNDVFVKHNIQKLSFTFGDESFYLTEPNIGMIRDRTIENKIFTDMIMSPPFGLKIDLSQVSVNAVNDGFDATPYPVAFVNLTNFGDKYSRIIPFLNDGSCLSKNSDLEINFTFTTNKAPDDVTFFVCVYYTDSNLTLDLRKKGEPYFSSPYVKKF